MMANKPMYDEWIAHRRVAARSRDLTDRVMAAVEKQDMQRSQREERVRLVDRMNASPPARIAVCLAALLVGCFPFLLVAYAAKLIVF